MNKMKCHVLMVAITFPSYHSRKNEYTNFPEQICNGLKIHTIREHFGVWQKKIMEVEEGKAYLSLRSWTGRPYHSRQHEWRILTNKDGVGIQKLAFDELDGYLIDDVIYDVRFNPKAKSYVRFESRLASNDGLCYHEFKEWFKSANSPIAYEKEMAIIHFTPFRYSRR